MASNELKLNLKFKVDTVEAKAKMHDLEKSLNNLFHVTGVEALGNSVNSPLLEANETVLKLHNSLKKAFNTDTGKLNLVKFNQEAKTAGLTVNKIADTFTSLGYEGKQAFEQLTWAIAEAETPIKRVNKTLDNFKKDLIKTARWQLSSNIIHGLQSGLEGAYRYAQDLNKSLNDIRIVTGHNVEYMSKFAVEANKAAKALSTSTNEYAKASLIYFQQGLEDQEVRKRADTTVKLANVTGQTAEEVSSYMTAVWNNFADGSKELEYYADVITKLGAATASSSEEIATGLQKFSAVAETVGLSYEYATAALATVTSQTRESAETVGTAFKTIFARLESLSLGETLDDDTSMTKYSQALASVGVNIKNSAGELKNMDSILDELGDKWNSISKDQQLALAQTVAGMRQYNNFMALMNNYDTFTANVELGSQATGSLQEQHEIYAESWEAASARVQAAAEDVYDSILNDEFFIKLTNGVEKLITGFGKLVDSVGGMEGVFGTLGLLLTKFAGKQIASGIEDAAINIKGLFGTLKDESNQVKLEFLDKLKELYKLEDFEEDSALSVEKTKANFLYKEAELQELLLKNDKRITDEAKEQIEQELEHLRVLEKIHEEQVATAADMQENAGKKGTEFKANFNNLRSVTEEKNSLQTEKDKVTAQKEAKREEIKAITDQLNQSGPSDNDETQQKRQKINEIQEQLAAVEKELERAKDNQRKAEEEYYTSVNVLDEAYNDAENDSTEIVEWADQAVQEAEETWGDFVEITEEVAQEVAKLKEQLLQSQSELEDAQKRLEDSNSDNKAKLQSDLEKAKREDIELEVQEASLEGEIEDRNDWANQAKNIALSINSDNQAEIDAWDLEQKALEEEFNAEQAQKEAQFNTDQAIKQEFNTAIDQFGNKELSHDDFNKKVQEIIDKATEVGAKELEEALKEIQADQSFGAQTVGKNKDKEDRSKRYERIKGKKFADADATYEKATYEKDESKRPELRKKTFEEVQGDLEAFAKEKGLSAKDTEELIASGLELAKTYRQNEEAAKAAAAGQEVMNNEQKKAEDLIKESVDGGRKWTELLVDTGGAVAGLTAGFSALKSAADVWTDDSNLSFWDRLKSSIGSIVTAIPTLVIAYKTLNKVITDQTTKNWLLSAAQAVNNKLTGENTQLQKENTEARDENNKEITEDIKEEGEKKVAEVIKDPSKLKGFGSKIKGGGKDFISGAKKTIELKKAAKAAKLAGTAGKAAAVAPGAAGAAASASGAAAGTAGTAGAAAGASGAAALGSIAVAAAPYVLAAAAIAAVAIVAYKHYNKAEDLAKEAEARAEALQGLANSAKESYQELSQAVTGFEDANNALKDLTKGTKEWNEALEASNEQARTLIDQFGTSLKAGDYFFNSDGQIQFKEGVLEELQAKQADAVAKTQATADFAKIEANEKRAEANLIKFSRKKVNSTKFGFDNNAQEQAGLNKLMDVYKQDSAVLDKLWAAIDSGNEASFAEQYDVSVDLIKALTENREATEQLFKETAAAANQSALLRQSIIENANKGNAEYANSEYKEIINAMAANDLENVEQSEDYKKALEDFDDLSFKNEDDQKKILQALYGENASKYRFTQTGGGDVTLETQDEDGNWVLVEGTQKNNYKKSTIKQQYAKAIAAGITTEEMTSLKDRTNKLVSDLTGMGFDSSQINAIGASLEKGTAVDLTKASRGALSNITDDSINNLDEKYQELMRKAKESTEQMWAEASTIYRTYAGEDAEFSENHTLESLRAVTSAASKIAIKGGSDAAIAFTDYADSIIDSYPSKADEINSILQNIDWDQSGPEAMADLRMQLEDIGISVNSTNAEWAAMLDKINEIKSSVDSFSLDKLRQEIAQTTKILDGLKNGNDVISDEDYKKLSEYSAEVADMFTLTADGYKFIGGATEAENRSKIKELEKITTKAAMDKSKDQLNKIDLAEKAKATMQLDKSKTGDQFQDMIWVGESGKEEGDKYTDFLKAMEIDPDELAKKGKQGQDARGKIANLQAKLETLEVGSAEYEDIQKQISEQEKLLADAQSFADTMYEKANWVKDLDPDQARKDNADLSFSEISSLEQLMELEEEYANDPNYAKAFKDRKTQLENEISLRRESIDTTQDEQAALKALNKEQEELAKKKKLSSGQDYLNNLTEEVKLINKEVDLYNKLAKNKEGDRNEAQSNISSLLGPNVAIKKDADGNITNWEALNNAAMAMSPEDVELYQRYKEEYNQAAEATEEYHDKIKEAKEDQKALWLEGATYTREYNDSIRELQYDWLENQLSNLEDAEYSAAEKMALLGQKAQLVKEESGDLTKELDKIATAVHIDRREGESDADFMARIAREAPEAEEKINQLAASYLANANSMKEIDKELANTLVQHFDQVAAQYDKVGDRIQRLSETTDHYKNIINLVGKKNIAGSEETLKALGEMQQRTANATLENSRAKYNKLKSEQQAAQDSLQAALDSGDEAAIAHWTKALEEIDNKVYDAQTKMNNDWAAALQTAADLFAENTATILENFESSLAGTFSSFDRMQEVFSQQSELNSQYVADYKRVYELSKLTRDIQNQIDNTDSITAKSELKDLQAEINELQESGAEMSQYDLDYLQKRYDLRLAELALEEARNAKSQVRLQKTENGGWGYVYTQNEDAVSNAQQNYEDKLYALQELSDNYLNETSEKIISTQANFEAAIQQIMSSGLSDEEKKEQVQETVEFYREKLDFLTSEFDDVIANNQGMANMVQSFSESLLGAMYPEGEFDSADNIFSNFNDQVGDWESGTGLLGELKTAMEAFKDGTVAIFAAAGYEGAESFMDGFMADANANANTDMDSGEYEVDEDAVPDVEPVLTSITETREALAAEYERMMNDYMNWLQGMANTKLVDGQVTTSSTTTSSTTGSGSTSSSNYTYSGVGNTTDRKALLESWGVLTEADSKYLEDNWADRESSAFQTKMRELWQRAIDRGFAASFDTGGYTGSWGSSGRMAMLHEKELVLNKEDTANLLKMVQLVDNIIKSIDASSFAALSRSAMNLPSISSTGETLQQEVTIHAEFPNATNHSEIEQAFNDLVNRAAQYTGRRK